MNTETTTNKKARALRLDVYRAAYGRDCTNGGISGRVRELLIPCAEGPIEYDPENPPEDLCTVKVIKVAGVVTLSLVPASLAGRWTMFGGNYATTSDSRLGEMLARQFGREFLFNHVLPIHDRIEV